MIWEEEKGVLGNGGIEVRLDIVVRLSLRLLGVC